MSQGICAQCGMDIDGTGIRHRGRLFCGDECCETYEEEFLTKGEPGLHDLDDDLDEDLDFDEDELEDEDLEDDDDIGIEEDDDN